MLVMILVFVLIYFDQVGFEILIIVYNFGGMVKMIFYYYDVCYMIDLIGNVIFIY